LTDVFVIGGGPAGAVLALRLARHGHDVTIAERSAFDHPRPGESLHRGAIKTLESLSLRPRVVRTSRTLVHWSAADDVVEHESIAVARPELDRFLLDAAREAGAKVLQPHAVDARPDATFVVDASGRASWSRAPRTRTGEPTMAVAAHVAYSGDPRVESLENGWLWGSPLPDGRYSVMAFVDRDVHLQSMLDASELFRGMHIEEVRHHDATTYACDVPWDDDVLRIGEASFSLDPLSSSGVHAAMQSAIHAAAALHTILTHPTRMALAKRFVLEAQRAAVQQHREWTAAFYAQCRFANAPFYQSRSAVATPPLSYQQAAFVKLSDQVTIEPVPCLVEDVIEARPGVVHADLPRPFVWLGGREVAALLTPLARGPRRAEELSQWWGAGMLDALMRNRIVVPCS
jgi:flavin-dependent dehydrogenase